VFTRHEQVGRSNRLPGSRFQAVSRLSLHGRFSFHGTGRGVDLPPIVDPPVMRDPPHTLRLVAWGAERLTPTRRRVCGLAGWLGPPATPLVPDEVRQAALGLVARAAEGLRWSINDLVQAFDACCARRQKTSRADLNEGAPPARNRGRSALLEQDPGEDRQNQHQDGKSVDRSHPDRFSFLSS
jgi:hypothetical protein